MVLLNIILKREIMKQMWKGKRGRKSWQKWEEQIGKIFEGSQYHSSSDHRISHRVKSLAYIRR